MMNQQRRTETEHLIDELQKMIVECTLQLEGGHPKYTTMQAWLKAGGELSDKISDILTEEQGAALRDSTTSDRERRDHNDLLESSGNLESALDNVNDAVDALGNENYEDARKRLQDTVDALRKAMS